MTNSALRWAVGCALLALPPLAAAQPPEVTLESLLATAFPTELTASPQGGRLAWLQNERGVRNVWVAEPPEYRGRPLTRYTEDDGEALGGLVWTPDGQALVYVRGSGANRAGEIANPRNDPAGAEQAIWRVALAGGDPLKLAQGSGAQVSPRGDGVAFLQKGGVYFVPLSGGEPEPWIKLRGGDGALRFSPDGGKLAFVSRRGDHGFVGVYDVAAKSVRFLAPGVDHDSSPAWSPDGSKIAFLREPASSRLGLFRPTPEAAEPWSILVADLASGATRTVFRAEPGPGSAFFEMVAANQILWTADNRLVFPWERDGWLHLYAVPAAGGPATLLTPGEGEVEYVSLAADGKSVLYAGNHGDLHRRHLWKVSAAGGAPAALTRGRGIEWMAAETVDGSVLAYLKSDARTPAHAAVEVRGAPARELAGAVAALPIVEPQAVTFAAADGRTIHGQLFQPQGLKPGERRPGVLFFHGGSHRQMLLGWHYLAYYHNAYALNQYLASRGFVVLSVNFRSGTGYGLDFREAPAQGAAGASEFNDVLGAGLYLRSRPDVDPDRIALWGGSYGGYLTALGLARASDLFAAGVDIHGVHDWNVGIRTFVPDYKPTPEDERLAFESSPLAAIDRWRSPVLLIHGDDDRNVSFSETVTLVEKLRERSVEHEVLVLPDEIHSFLRYESWLRAFKAAAEFLGRRLQARPAG